MHQYSWKKKFLSFQTDLYLDDTIIGYFTFGVFMKSYIELLGNSYTVKKNSIWGYTYEVYKNEDKTPIAKLIFPFWSLSAKIEYNNTVYEMIYRTSLLLFHFHLYHKNQSIYDYDASKYRGHIKVIEKEDPLLIILGLYCHASRRRNN